MKKILTALFLFAAAAVSAQTVQPAEQTATPVAQDVQPGAQDEPVQYRFGFLDYRAVFESMPEYDAAQKSLEEIKAKYDAETLHNEEDFRRMYLEFLQGQKEFPQTIMLKRQKELKDLLQDSLLNPAKLFLKHLLTKPQIQPLKKQQTQPQQTQLIHLPTKRQQAT